MLAYPLRLSSAIHLLTSTPKIQQFQLELSRRKVGTSGLTSCLLPTSLPVLFLESFTFFFARVKTSFYALSSDLCEDDIECISFV